ncbi:MAG: neuraminidase-like domain-containing protein [Acidobacteriota bacterium]
MPALRDALVWVSSSAGLGHTERAKWIEDRLLIDMRTKGCTRTTRVSQALETLQGLLSSVRNRLLNDTYPDLDLDADDFDEAWRWIGSYSTWRTAMLVFLYPENLAVPSLRRHGSAAFRSLVREVRRNRRLTPEQAREAGARYADYFKDVARLRLEATCQTRTRMPGKDGQAAGYADLCYLFARGSATGTLYVSTIDPEDASGHAQSSWRPVPGVGDVVDVVGATPFELPGEERFIYLFLRVREAGHQNLVFVRYDLERRSWDGDPTELDLPVDTASFTAVVKQTTNERQRPQLAVRLAYGAVFHRRLNRDGNDWEDREWRLLIGQGYGLQSLDAMIETEDGSICLVATIRGRVQYRLYGTFNDGRWRQVAPGAFNGAFRWPGDAKIYVFVRQGGTSAYRVITPSETDGAAETIDSVATMDSWLRHAAGANLRTVQVEDGPYAGDSLYDLMVLSSEDDPNPWGGNILRMYLRRAVRALVSKAEEADETDRRYGPWKLAARYVRWFSIDSVSLTTALMHAAAGAELTFRHRNDGAEASGPFGAAQGMDTMAGMVGAVDDPQHRIVSYRRTAVQPGLYRCRFDRLADGQLVEVETQTAAPRVAGPFSVPDRLSESKLQFRRALVKKVFQDNQDSPASNLAYLEEAYFLVPMHLALELQSRGHYTAALDWIRSVYDFSMPAGQRKIYYGLHDPEHGGMAPYERTEDWLIDPLDPHRIAAARTGVTTRFTLLALVRCLLAYADAEFTRDTSESVARARLLYLTALEILDTPGLAGSSLACTDQIGSLQIEVGDDQWIPALAPLQKKLAELRDPVQLTLVVDAVRQLLAGSDPWQDRFAAAHDAVDQALAEAPPSKSFAEVLSERAALTGRLHLALEAEPSLAAAGRRASRLAVGDFHRAVSLVSGLRAASLGDGPVALPWLREKLGSAANEPTQTLVPRTDHQALTQFDPLTPSHVANLSKLATEQPQRAIQITSKALARWVPAPSFNFFVPPNPVVSTLRLRAELELHKLRTCRNIAGLERQLEPFSAPTDTVSGLPTIGSGGQLNLPGLSPLKPTSYRYPVLIERARRLTSLAQQVESTMLASLEKGDAERYSRLKARQDVQMARRGVRLQQLRVREARNGVELAELQQDRSQILVDRYAEYLDEDLSVSEIATLGFMLTSATLSATAAVYASAALKVDYSGIFSNLASGASSLASFFSTLASYERRRQEWQLQKDLAEQDVRIGGQQVVLARDRVRVVEQERVIAELSVDQAREVVEFLSNKFTSVELYDWMSGVLEGVYASFLQQATATARLAADQLTFEHQETPPPFLQEDYWRPPADGLDEEGALDRRGLTGATRLLQDIELLDQHAFEVAKRPLQLSKTVSLAQMAPAEFQRFRETGVMVFQTPMELYDRDFPGHYLRRIRSVRTSVVALIPPVEGIRATLSTLSSSRIVVGGDVFQETTVNHGPQSVALTSPRNASGVFELDTQSEMLLPFEGMGVDATWEFRLPRAANPFDFRTLADVLVTFEYTALDSYLYRQQVLQSLPSKTRGDRPFSFRHQLADAWFDLHNPDQTATPMTVDFTITRQDFPPHLENLEIEHLVLYFARADGSTFEVPVDHLQFQAQGASEPTGAGASTVDGVVSTRRGNGSGWLPIIGQAPVGEWQLALPDTTEMRGRFEDEEIVDILLVVSFKGRLPAWPA